MIGRASQLGEGTMLSCRNHSFVDDIVIRVEQRRFPLHSGKVSPEVFSTGLAAVPDIKSNDLARCGIHRDPAPLAVRLLAHEAPALVQLSLQAL